MSKPVIKVENLGKKYIISHQQQNAKGYKYKALRDVISDGTKTFAKKILKPKSKETINPTQEEFWALQGINFQIGQGEAVGIIGRNGAGKSTLLKLLSRITEPTTGRISIQGRVASLLEVGTGFHPELTGRENIFLNGSVMGMTRVEIKQKFAEIVDFAEVEKFLDTPVKRYSSGMYVRLAFAVAAHLEPEILVVDEVLAVGDAAFQKKCLGKMGDVATKEGRTVLFVSHSMQAIAQLTKRCILLNKGGVQFDGNTDKAVGLYIAGQEDGTESPAFYQAPASKTGSYLASAQVHSSEDGVQMWGKAIEFEFTLQVDEPSDRLRFLVEIVNDLQQPVTKFWLFKEDAPFFTKSGLFTLRCQIPKLRLYGGSYTLRTWFFKRSAPHTLLESLTNICPFEITMGSVERPGLVGYEWKPNECSYLEDATWEISE
ncbi:ABC transporter ATP-binding protein [Waterburya agarophytonicola K14]|uniref:ABC transporter ATP-binding protein n=1 Tax=Waterburya agarophytonicola KI4 TaxID=2874699 RepID=A0A964BR51_9CYAN|nr:ABC transporter ATP-binding protein [Waterburya agarophytonicola]MCC0176762.1 ABC transporter ATP-binding protein [Waterburya agarophytonicola KI4]